MGYEYSQTSLPGQCRSEVARKPEIPKYQFSGRERTTKWIIRGQFSFNSNILGNIKKLSCTFFYEIDSHNSIILIRFDFTSVVRNIGVSLGGQDFNVTITKLFLSLGLYNRTIRNELNMIQFPVLHI